MPRFLVAVSDLEQRGHDRIFARVAGCVDRHGGRVHSNGCEGSSSLMQVSVSDGAGFTKDVEAAGASISPIPA